LLDDLEGVAVERRATGEQLVEHRAELADVGDVVARHVRVVELFGHGVLDGHAPVHPVNATPPSTVLTADCTIPRRADLLAIHTVGFHYVYFDC